MYESWSVWPVVPHRHRVTFGICSHVGVHLNILFLRGRHISYPAYLVTNVQSSSCAYLMSMTKSPVTRRFCGTLPTSLYLFH